MSTSLKSIIVYYHIHVASGSEISPTIKSIMVMILSLILHRPQYREKILFLALRMIQQVLLTIRYKNQPPCNLSKFTKKLRPSVTLGLTTIVQGMVAIIFSKEMVITGRHAYQMKNASISLNARVL